MILFLLTFISIDAICSCCFEVVRLWILSVVLVVVFCLLLIGNDVVFVAIVIIDSCCCFVVIVIIDSCCCFVVLL